KPRWEMWVVEGLEGGDHFAITTKVHHCMIDGMSSVDLLAVLLTPAPTESFDEPPRWLPRPAPSGWQLVTAELGRRLRAPFAALGGLGALLESAADPRSDLRVMWRALRMMLRSSLRIVSNTPIN